ncbi:MAG: methylaspartate ammonia-lyase [Rhodospirillaceae bacterium]|nr:methylaspartate ammonia-lyase [Rhodospirillaceae bacterium]MDD9917371.1 methylaspartate ammonia-lyase [Rhodospirillaceae bacterium]MDD9925184.1 methylaspartate ammonia-lyase [Rhodospirillaceae bacterium]
MKIAGLLCAAGRSGYFNKDLAAIRAGARQEGFTYIDPPVTPGFDEVIQAGQSLSVMLQLDDGQVAHGDCIDVIFTGAAGRDPLFKAEAQRGVVEGAVRDLLVGRDCSQFRPLADEVEGFEPDGAPLHTALRYGISQSLLHAAALAQKRTPAEIVAAEYGCDIATGPIPILGMCPTPQTFMVEKMIMKGVDILPHGSFANVEADLGLDGHKLIDYAAFVSQLIGKLGAEGYKPAIHLDVYGTIGELFDFDMARMADYVGRVAEAAAPYDLYLETPMIADSRQGQIDAFRDLRDALGDRGSTVKLVADEWCNTLDDIRAFADARAADYLQVKAPDLGGIGNSIEALLYCRKAGAGVYMGGSANETDQSARLSAHVALACRADFLMNKPGQGVDEGLVVLTNEMARTLALIGARG